MHQLLVIKLPNFSQICWSKQQLQRLWWSHPTPSTKNWSWNVLGKISQKPL